MCIDLLGRLVGGGGGGGWRGIKEGVGLGWDWGGARTTRIPGQETPSSRKKLGGPLNSIHYISKSCQGFDFLLFCKWKTIYLAYITE